MNKQTVASLITACLVAAWAGTSIWRDTALIRQGEIRRIIATTERVNPEELPRWTTRYVEFFEDEGWVGYSERESFERSLAEVGPLAFHGGFAVVVLMGMGGMYASGRGKRKTGSGA